ncbi:DNA cytosine methyltransferase [Streptococcus gallolyticus]|uniref:DNA (cytosine-5-)-methyltransferase n=1 Tax=Streptococcus gallolyticus TaxID=315405 RepID=A0A368UE18_9STRE|nr:DNA cytosine methyltransferase [Streptococcus gallolyticus]RCW17131.1 DNA cytosine methyltransferase [Streptococcus gallolyticus]
MPFCYDKLWNLTYEKRLNKTNFRDAVGITNSTLSRLSKGETVSMEVLARICEYMECRLEDIVEYKRGKMNYISLFSSSGVGCYGFKMEGFDGVASSELIERRLQVQKANNKLKYDDGYILGNITEEKTKKRLFDAVNMYKRRESISEIDTIIFTAPCQGMSVANHKKNDGTIEKNSLVVEALEIVKKIKPKFFIAENVRAFMNTKCIDHDIKKTISQAFKDWLSLDYVYESRVINFKDYGANSSRTRTLVIGVRKDLSINVELDNLFPKKEKEKTLRELIFDLPRLDEMGEISSTDIYHNFKAYRKDMRSWIHDVKPGHSAFENSDITKRPHRLVEGRIVENVQKNGDKYTRQRWDCVAPCVHTRNDILASQNTIHPEDDRVFSIRELMIMMNIPESFKWTTIPEDKLNTLTLEEKKQYLKKNEINIRQSIGEAIPTIIIQKIAHNIKEVLKNDF